MIKLIVAYDENKLIGIADQLPWSISDDLKQFKEYTIGKKILMGDVTFDGIGKPLPNRETIILTLDKTYKYEHENVSVENDLNKIVKKYQKNENEDIVICGGATIYKLFLPFVDELRISKIKNKFKGDVYFPEWNINEFELVDSFEYPEFILETYKRL